MKVSTIVSRIAVLILAVMVMSGCYYRHSSTLRSVMPDSLSESQEDSISFSHTHHYSENFNFIVKADSMALLRQQPEELLGGMQTDTLMLRRGDRVVVVDIRKLPADAVDSIWIQLARDQESFGWVHETEMLPMVVPDDPISQFISTFSDAHLLVSLIVLVVISIAYLMRILLRQRSKIVHFNDIASFYPTLLALIVATSASFYASIQLFAADTWQNFYFHPTLNPFSVTPLLSVFLASVWLMLIIALAAVDEVRHALPFGEALLYLCGLLGLCAFNYIVFSLTTLYYIGYPLLIAYYVYAIRTYLLHSSYRYVCGNCGALMRKKGKCPVCGMMNE